MSQPVLNRTLVLTAFEFVRPKIEAALAELKQGSSLVLVVSAIETINPRDGRSFEESCYLIHEFGDPSKNDDPIRDIALSKTEISVRTGKATRDVRPQELLAGETLKIGSVVVTGVVVGASGTKGVIDEMISGWVAYAIQMYCELEVAAMRDREANFVGE